MAYNLHSINETEYSSVIVSKEACNVKVVEPLWNTK